MQFWPKNVITQILQSVYNFISTLVMDPLTNTMLNGPNAPTEATLHTWLQSHPTFHVVLPKSDTRSKFYGTNTSKFYG